ncbi:MAG TPA: VanZ family protein [Candidatus Omnitrophota bacterium]|nr:VanZ family protein [Candidatus Omnitrophota bacterium]
MKFLRFWFPVLSYSAIIFYVSSQPYLNLPLGNLISDKIYHSGEYAVLGFLFCRALYGTHGFLPKGKILLFVILFCFFYGASDELHQMFVPGRQMDAGDLLSDAIGGFLGGWLYPLRKFWSYSTSHRQ